MRSLSGSYDILVPIRNRFIGIGDPGFLYWSDRLSPPYRIPPLLVILLRELRLTMGRLDGIVPVNLKIKNIT